MDSRSEYIFLKICVKHSLSTFVHAFPYLTGSKRTSGIGTGFHSGRAQCGEVCERFSPIRIRVRTESFLATNDQGTAVLYFVFLFQNCLRAHQLKIITENTYNGIR